MKLHFCIAVGLPLFGAGSALAADPSGEMTVKINIPTLNVAEYHKPYVALWLENADQSFVGNLAVWYDIKKKDNGGTKWLKDMRQWWRKSGRDLKMPVDGISGATHGPGDQTVTFNAAKSPLNNLPAGQYQLVVEAAREAGGRDLVRLPFQWPAKAAFNASAKGKEELGTVTLDLKP